MLEFHFTIMYQTIKKNSQGPNIFDVSVTMFFWKCNVLTENDLSSYYYYCTLLWIWINCNHYKPVKGHGSAVDLLPSLFSHMLVVTLLAPDPRLIAGLTLLTEMSRLWGYWGELKEVSALRLKPRGHLQCLIPTLWPIIAMFIPSMTS